MLSNSDALKSLEDLKFRRYELIAPIVADWPVGQERAPGLTRIISFVPVWQSLETTKAALAVRLICFRGIVLT